MSTQSKIYIGKNLVIDAVENISYTKYETEQRIATALESKPSSSDFDNIVKITQSDYDLITPDPNTLYIITI